VPCLTPIAVALSMPLAGFVSFCGRVPHLKRYFIHGRASYQHPQTPSPWSFFRTMCPTLLLNLPWMASRNFLPSASFPGSQLLARGVGNRHAHLPNLFTISQKTGQAFAARITNSISGCPSQKRGLRPVNRNIRGSYQSGTETLSA